MATKRTGFARARKAAGYTQETLASAMRVDPTTVGNWERGDSEPQPHRRTKLANLLGVTQSELEDLLLEAAKSDPKSVAALSSTPEISPMRLVHESPIASHTPRYVESLDQALVQLSTVAGIDEAGALGPWASAFAGGLPAQAIRAWHIGPTQSDLQHDGAPVRLRDVDEIIATTKSLDQLDRQFSGDYCRNLAVKYLADRVLPLVRRPASDSVRSELFQAAAVLCEVIGYMAYDAQLHGLAQHYFGQALRLTQEAGHPAYGAFVLATMSHQALYLDRPDQALTLAQAARRSPVLRSAAAVTTEAAMLEATANAALGDTDASKDALRRAEASYERHDSAGEAPYWMAHWDDAVFASFASTAWLDLGELQVAEPYLQTLSRGTGGQVRRQVFAAGQRARAALLEHDMEQCAHYGTMAAEAAAATGSKRSHRIVRDLLVRLEGHQQLQPVRELTETVTALLPSEAP